MFVQNSTLRHFEVVTVYIKLLTLLIIKKEEEEVINYFILSKSPQLPCH